MKSIAYYRRKADKAIQGWGKRTYKLCLVCGQPMSCLHHYFPKSISTNLRYNTDNLIPICQSCHFKHHNGDPRIQNAINGKIGKSRINYLLKEKNKLQKVGKKFYQDIIEKYGR